MRILWLIPIVALATPAGAYPGGTSVSLGTNPVFAHGGNLGIAANTTVFTAPADQIKIVTDITLGLTQTSRSCELSLTVRLKTDEDVVLAEFGVGMPDLYNHPGSAQGYHFQSGLPLAAGQSLIVETETAYQECSSSYYRLRYTISGYSAQP